MDAWTKLKSTALLRVYAFAKIRLLWWVQPSVLENDQGVRARYSRISTPEEKSPTIVAHKKNKSSEAMTNDSQ